MSANTSQRLNALETAVKSLKSAYNVAGGAVNFQVTSQTYTIAVASGSALDFRVKFTPTYGMGKNSITTLHLSVQLAGAFIFGPFPTQEIQDGTGEIFIAYKANATIQARTFTITVTASGPSTGTFTRVS